MFIVYRYMIGDQWIYVGKTKYSLEMRYYEHSSDKRFKPYRNAKIYYCELETEHDMDITETMLIKMMQPIINVNDKKSGALPFLFDESALAWKEFVPKNGTSRSGRPLKGDERLSMELKIRIGPQMLQSIKDVCEKINIPRNEFVRAAITKLLDETKINCVPIDTTE